MSRGTGGKGRSGRDGSAGRGSGGNNSGGASGGGGPARGGAKPGRTGGAQASGGKSGGGKSGGGKTGASQASGAKPGGGKTGTSPAGGGKTGGTKSREAKARGAAARARVAEMRTREAARKRRRNWLAGIGAAVVVIIAAVAITLAVTSNSGGPASAAGGTPKLKLASLAALGTLKPLPSPGRAGPEQVPVPPASALASTATKATGKTVDGIGCDTTEQLVYHIHAHLTVFVNGAARQVPAGIGIPGAQAQNTPTGPFIASGSCFYWLHVHAANKDTIHIESPGSQTFTLGQFFAIWNAWDKLNNGPSISLDATHVATFTVTPDETVAVYVDKQDGKGGQPYTGDPSKIVLASHEVITIEITPPAVTPPPSFTFASGL